MHPVVLSVGFAFDSESIDEPESLSEIVTVPAVNALLGFDVVLENAENVPVPATLPATPTTSIVTRSLRARPTSASHPPGVELERDVLDRALVAGGGDGEPYRNVHLRGTAGTQEDGSRAPSTKGADGSAKEGVAACPDAGVQLIVECLHRGQRVYVDPHR